VIELLRRWRDEVGDGYVLGAVRVVLGLLLFANALRALRELVAGGYFGDAFHWPFLPEALLPSRTAYAGIVVAQLLLAVLVVAGRGARAALLASALLGTYVLLCDRLQFHHNRWELFCEALLLSLAPCDRSFTIARAASRSRLGPMWAARLAAVQVSLVYVASGGSKLLDPDWRDGQVILERFRLYAEHALASGVPQRVVQWLSRPQMTSALAKAAIATELFLALGLWARHTRVLALWWGVWFHLTIEATSRVEGFTWLTLACYALFVTPDVRARRLFFDASQAKGRAAARIVRWLDWFARFEVKPWAADDVRQGRAVAVVRRDGSPATGVRALAMVARCTPLLFPLWAPLALVASVAPPARPPVGVCVSG
jgi:hypothetical protein